MIGDNIEKDMVGAKQALNAITFLRGGMLPRLNRPASVDKVFKDFCELLPLLQKKSPRSFTHADNMDDFQFVPARSGNE